MAGDRMDEPYYMTVDSDIQDQPSIVTAGELLFPDEKAWHPLPVRFLMGGDEYQMVSLPHTKAEGE